MINETLFRATAVVSVAESNSRTTYTAQLYDKKELIYSKNIRSLDGRDPSPCDIASAAFDIFLDSGEYKRLSEKQRKSLAEYLAERKKNPKKAENRLVISLGRNLVELIEFEIVLLERDPHERIVGIF